MLGELAKNECHELAALHLECLPDSLVSLLGHGYATAFYRYVCNSRHELAFVYREGGRIASGCVLSVQPRTLSRRLAVRTALLLSLPRAFLRWRRARRRDDRATNLDGTKSKKPVGAFPEVILLFTAPYARGQGRATELLARCEQFLSHAGYTRYVVETADVVGNPALVFYARSGFVPCGRSVRQGRPFRILMKTITANPGGGDTKCRGCRWGDTPGPTPEGRREGLDDTQVRQVATPAQRIYNVLFPGRIPDELQSRFEQAWSILEGDYTELERAAHQQVVQRVGDLEALELACRHGGRLSILTDQVKLMSFLAETLPGHYEDYVGSAATPWTGCFALVLAGVRSAAKYGRGLLLRGRIHGS
jgi:GNAT superfamily N-acetyltransferase